MLRMVMLVVGIQSNGNYISRFNQGGRALKMTL